MMPSDAGTRSADLTRPPALRAGDRVAVLSVSSPAPPAQLEMGLDVLRFAGLDPVLYPSARDQGSMRRYLAGDDRMRAADLRAALSDPTIAGIVFAIGGSGRRRQQETERNFAKACHFARLILDHTGLYSASQRY